MKRNQAKNQQLKEMHRRYSRSGQLRMRWQRVVRGLAWGMLCLLADCKRAVDFIISALLLLLLSPLFCVLLMVCKDSSQLLQRTPRLGRWGKVFPEYSFTQKGFRDGETLRRCLQRLPVLLNVFAGDMAIVGPRPVSPGDLSARDREARKRYDVRPGLVCLWWLRQQANIPFEGENNADVEYVANQSLRGDLGIMLRAVPSVLMGRSPETATDKINILGHEIDNLTMGDAVDRVVTMMQNDEPMQVCFVNADCVNVAVRDNAYRDVLNDAGLTLADGIGMRLAGKMLGQPVRENVNGTDLFPLVCERLAGSDQGVYLLGGRPEIADRVAIWVEDHHPTLKLCGTHHGYFSAEEEADVLADIAASGAALLLVAFGAPKQEKWIAQHLQATGVQVAMGVGGLFDFYSGNIPRAPQWMREVSVEWVYRFWQEPGRMWKRYLLGNGLFLWRVARQKINKK